MAQFIEKLASEQLLTAGPHALGSVLCSRGFGPRAGDRTRWVLWFVRCGSM